MASEIKEKSVSNLTTELKSSQNIVITEYQGMTATEFDELRSALRPVGAKYKVVKNRLAKIALEGAGFSDVKGYLKGPSAIAYHGNDGAAITKVLFKFGETHTNFKVRAGRVCGITADSKNLKAIADLPSREVLLATLLSRMISPLQTLATTFNEPLRSLQAALTAVAKKKQPAAA